MAQTLEQVETEGWGANTEALSGSLARNLRHVASVLRHDDQGLGPATDLCFFHISTGGYDTHSQQGATDVGSGHPRLLDRLSRSIYAFQRDLEGLGLADRVATVLSSRPGRPRKASMASPSRL